MEKPKVCVRPGSPKTQPCLCGHPMVPSNFRDEKVI